MKILNSLTLASVAVALSLSGCKKDYLDRKPTTQVPFEDVFSTVEGARAAINGIHRMMYEYGGNQHYEFGQASINLMYDLMGDDIVPSGPGHFDASYSYQGARTGGATAGYSWGFYYRMINNANFIIANVDQATGSDAAKADIKAQALFYRAYAYYNLANCYMYTYNYGDIKQDTSGPGLSGNVKNAPCVPIYTEPTQTANGRATVAEVYERITQDLTDAIALFETGGMARSDKSQIDINVAKGLAARVYLVMNDWTKAAKFANEARSLYTYMTGSELTKGFNDINNTEWMWGSAINAEQATSYASLVSFMDRDAGGYTLINGPLNIAKPLFDTFRIADTRRGQFISRSQAGVYTALEPRKFRIRTKGSWVADYPLMRAAEMGLIEAEALAQQGRVSEGAAVLEELVKTRQADYVAPTTSNAEDLIMEIWLQRRIELWGEGFRFFDIKRTAAMFPRTPKFNATSPRLDRIQSNTQISGGVKTMARDDVRFLFRIPNSELVQNRLIVQNP